MVGEWRDCALGDVIELKRGYDLPQQQRSVGKVPLVSSSGVSDHVASAMAKGPGVVTGRYGTLGQVFYIESDFWPLNTTLYIRDFKGNDPRFISYFLRGVDFFAYSDKAAVPGLNRNHLHQATIRYPTDIAEQRAIAHILGSLDDKIELNRRMSETLEAMARAIYKSWFVDFDPVRAKAEGRDTGLPKSVADLFPDRLVESEMGKIPKDWEVRGLGQCLALLKDGSHNPPRRVQAGVRFIAGATDVKHFSVDFAKCTYITEDDYATMHRKWSVQAGDVLLTIVGTVGNVALVAQHDLPFSLQRSIAVLRPGPILSSSFLYCLLDAAGFRAGVKSCLNPTAQPGIYLGSLAAIPICLPAQRVVAAFDAVASALFTKMQNTVQETRTLAALHDTLLPKLLSGELRVRDADRFVAEVAA